MEKSLDNAEISIKQVISQLVEQASIERQKTDSYKTMFTIGSSYTDVLRMLEFNMIGGVLDATEVLKKKHNRPVNKDQFNFLLALPYLVHQLEKEICDKEGISCSVDKVYFLLSEQFKRLQTVEVHENG